MYTRIAILTFALSCLMLTFGCKNAELEAHNKAYQDAQAVANKMDAAPKTLTRPSNLPEAKAPDPTPDPIIQPDRKDPPPMATKPCTGHQERQINELRTELAGYQRDFKNSQTNEQKAYYKRLKSESERKLNEILRRFRSDGYDCK